MNRKRESLKPAAVSVRTRAQREALALRVSCSDKMLARDSMIWVNGPETSDL